MSYCLSHGHHIVAIWPWMTWSTSILLHCLIYAYIAWSMHTSRDLCIHRIIYAYIAWSMHTSHDLCIHRVIYAYIAWSMHTSRDLCIHRVIYAYIAWSMHTSHDLWYIICYTSHDLCIHQVTYGYIKWSMIHPLLMKYFYKGHPINNSYSRPHTHEPLPVNRSAQVYTMSSPTPT